MAALGVVGTSPRKPNPEVGVAGDVNPHFVLSFFLLLSLPIFVRLSNAFWPEKLRRGWIVGDRGGVRYSRG